jgi:phospholipid transport system substrate-binding protein
MRSTRLFLSLGVLFLTFTSLPGYSAAPSDAGKFVQNLANDVLAIFNQPQLSRDQKEKRMYPLAVKAFDVPRTARFVLGRYWKDTPQAQRDQFTRTFEHYIVHIYTGQFDLYHDVEFRIVDIRPQDAMKMLVRTKIIRHDGGPSVAVDWWVIKTDDTYKIIDVTVEGVSELVALREQFMSVIDQHAGSVAALIEHLQEKTADSD